MDDYEPQRDDETDEAFIARRAREIAEERARMLAGLELPAE
jgi:hypothetical protein